MSGDLAATSKTEALASSRTRIARHCVCCGSSSLRKSPAVLMPFVAHRAFGWTPAVIDETWGLSSISNGNAYSLCNSIECPDCGLLFLDIRFSEEEMASLYSGYRGDEYVHLRERYEPGYRDRNERLAAGAGYLHEVERFLSPHLPRSMTILDWGGDTGRNTPFAGRWLRRHVLDINEEASASAAERVSKRHALQQRYDLVVCSNVLEHVPHPYDTVMEMRGALGRGTVLYLEVPFENLMRSVAPASRLTTKRHWHEHVNFFTESALRCLLTACRLRVIDFRILEADGGGSARAFFQLACALAE
jgi:hypothetical protein